MRRWIVDVTVMVLLLSFGGMEDLQAASSFADPSFQTQWQQGEALAINFWGPLATAKVAQQESYKEAAGGQRLVQYFDKGRMELTNGAVTNGLLATEIIKGQIQAGDATFLAKAAPAIPIAGDPDNPGPTYAQLGSKGKSLFDTAPKQIGNATQATVSASGDVAAGNATASPATTFATYDDATKHNVPKSFADYRGTVGLQTIGYAQSEPFFAAVKVAGQQKQVMVQVFERRVMTYTANNPPAFQVEMGNIGQHYYQWRYGTAPVPSPAPPPPPTTVPPTATVSPPSSPIGQRVADKTLAITLNGVRDPAPPEPGLGPGSGNRCVGLDITVEALSDQSYNPAYAALQTSDDRRYERDYACSSLTPQTSATNMRAGDRLRTWTVFIIPANAIATSYIYSSYEDNIVIKIR